MGGRRGSSAHGRRVLRPDRPPKAMHTHRSLLIDASQKQRLQGCGLVASSSHPRPGLLNRSAKQTEVARGLRF